MSIERNSEGCLLMDPEKVAAEVTPKFSRYNGGWIKRVDGLDKKYANGYSLVGEFVEKGLQWLKPGLYLDCSIEGSRKHPERRYSLFRLLPDGTSVLLAKAGDYRDWAPRMWPAIEAALAEYNNEEKKYSACDLGATPDQVLIEEITRRGYRVERAA